MATDERITIRPETRADHDAIAEVLERAFGSPAEARLVDAIRASDEYIAELALVATLRETLVGQVMISGCAVVGDDTTTSAVMLSPLAVDASISSGRVVYPDSFAVLDD